MSHDDEVFAEAIEIAPGERAAFLDQACAGDAKRRARIEALLAGHDRAGGFLNRLPGGACAAVGEEKAGDLIGRYKLLQKIGEGGCGIVYLAEQEEPVRRRVALKVIKLGMDTKAVVARFEAERQALAMMDHPNIARVFDAGATATGRPFFVMELVRGIPITAYCDEHHFTPAQRVELLIPVCHAIQHAHQKGVIHRDIKPSNILVTVHDGAPTAKVIDFGIAKATQGRLTDHTLFTAFEQFIGTPVYMSPEQADRSSLDVDTRSDIYSLGVLLYELLTGRTPFDPKSFRGAGVDEIRHCLREVEPPRPSTRLRTLAGAEQATAARQRGTAPGQLSLLLCGDLDWIVMRCLEKDRTRRYDTASALAMDLQRHLRHEPVLARPPSSAYLLRKWVRRHRFGFFAITAIATAVIGGGTISVGQAVRARRAEREQSRMRAVETDLRRRAETAELATRRRAYVADINLVQEALAADNLRRALDLLNRQRPQAGDTDLRGWEWRYLWQFCQSDALSVLATKPDTTINSVAVSADGTWLAAGEVNYGGLSVWNLQTREEIRVPAGRSGVKVTFAPREPLLAIAVYTEERPNCRVWLWDVNERRVRRELMLGATSYCTGMFFSADGQTLATSRLSPDNEITLWRVSDGRKMAAFPAPAAGMEMRYSAFAVNQDLSLAAYYTRDGNRLHVMDLATGKDLWAEPAADEYVLSIAFSPDGKLLASGAGWSESAIRLWDVASGKAIGRLEGGRRFVGQMVFWRDGRTLASAGGDHTVRVWDVPTRRLIRTLRGHRSEVNTLALLPDGRTLASGSKDGTVMFWDGTADRVKGAHLQFPGAPTAIRFSPTGDAFITMDPQGRVIERRGRNFQEAKTRLNLESSAAATLARNCPLVATRPYLNRIQVWDWERNTMVRELPLRPNEIGFFPVAFTADGASVMIARGRSQKSNWLEEWELAADRLRREWRLPDSGPVPTLSPDGRYFAAPRSRGRFLQLKVAADEAEAWVRTELATGAEAILPATTRESVVASAGFSPDGALFAAGSAAGFVDVIDVATWQQVTTLAGVMAGMYSPAFSPDGRRIAIASSGLESITLWDVATFERLLSLPTPNSVLGVTTFSPDGNVIAARSASGTLDPAAGERGALHVWRAPSWEEIEAAEKPAPAR